ncbi:chalcone isomerase [Gautieria morchelliformis]|nr:chalcone isomerase [Gautieria morchelliformis]
MLSEVAHSDDCVPTDPNTVKDPATDIEFPSTLHIPSRFPLPTYTLLGVGVRKVSFLNVKVYSVGFYADLTGAPPISRHASFDEKIRHLVENSSCVMRIIPTRSTSYSHLRDGFMRALQARMVLHRNKGLITADEEAGAVSPLLKFKSIFPNTPLTKHTPLDVLLTPPATGPTGNSNSQERRLIVRDLGSISSNWVSKEFMLAYFEGQGISPPLKQAVENRLMTFGN